MSRIAQICWLVMGLSLASLLAIRYVMGGWINALYFPLGLASVSLLAAIILDFKFYLEFFSMRTTKHGLNMGTMILLVLAFLVAVNFLSVQKNRSWDLTEDKLFSLSEQSVDVLKNLDSSVEVVILYKGQSARDELQRVRESFKLYQDASSQFQVKFLDAYVDNLMAQDYLNDQSDRSQASIFAFINYKERRERVDAPIGESEITSALVKATRKISKTVYFLVGHGEKDLDNRGEDGLGEFKAELEKYAAQVKTLNLLEEPKIPADATAIILAGPTTALLDQELKLLLDYAKGGGHLMLMADPGQKHNLQQLLRPLGVDFSNTYVINGGVQIAGVTQLAPAGLQFDPTSEITKPFVAGKGYVLFFLASEVKKAPDSPKNLSYLELVKTSNRGASLTELVQGARQGEMRAYTLALLVKGKIEEGDTAKETSVVVFGDSDFATNKLLYNGLNRDLAMNAVGFLTGEKDLISIRPKQPRGSKVAMTNLAQLGIVGGGILVPVALFIFGSVIWFRRRGA